jgi:hypothetical protein
VDATGAAVAIEVIWSATGGTITPAATLGPDGPAPAVMAELAPLVGERQTDHLLRRARLTARRH